VLRVCPSLEIQEGNNASNDIYIYPLGMVELKYTNALLFYTFKYSLADSFAIFTGPALT